MNTNIMSEIMQLSVNERLQLVEDIWESIHNQPEELTLTDAEKEILDKRLDEFQKHPEQTVSWEEVKKNILSAV